MRLTIFVLTVTAMLSGCFAPEQPPITGRTEKFELTAKHIDQTFHLFVRLPPEYEEDTTREFPLVVQLDANLPVLEEFKVAAGFASRLEAQKALAPCVVVGIGYATGDENMVKRFRDLSLALDPEFRAVWNEFPDGDAPAFYDFMRDELLPELSTRYRIAGPSQRLLSGHSLGGYFVLYAMTRHDAAPLFGHFLAASPAIHWNRGEMLKLWNGYGGPTEPVTLFAAAGDLEGPEMMGYFDEFFERLRASSPALTLETRVLNTDHPGTVAPSLAEGLPALASHGFGARP